jgi:hypothetical protein
MSDPREQECMEELKALMVKYEEAFFGPFFTILYTMEKVREDLQVQPDRSDAEGCGDPDDQITERRS